jgi:hypothetical protein
MKPEHEAWASLQGTPQPRLPPASPTASSRGRARPGRPPPRGAFRDVRRHGRALPCRRGHLRQVSASPTTPRTSGLERDRRAGKRPRAGPMRDSVLAAFLTLAVFAAGFGAGLWAERHRPVPEAPRALHGGVRRQARRPARTRPPVNRAQLLRADREAAPRDGVLQHAHRGDLRRVRPRHGARS